MNEKMNLTKTQIRTRRLLITTMEKLLTEQKFENITINDICEQALVTRSTFYRYFNDKYELTEQMIMYISDRDFQYCDGVTFFDSLENYIQKNLQIINNLNPSNQSRLNFYTEFLDIMEKVIISYVKNSTDSENDVVVTAINNSGSPKKIIEFISGGMTSLLIKTSGLDMNEYKQNVRLVEDILTKLAK